MRSLLYFLLNPLTLGIALVIFVYGLSTWKPKLSRAGWWIAGLYGGFLLLTPFPKLLVASWESRYPPMVDIACARGTHIVVLASGFTADERLPASGQLNSSSLARLVEGLRLAMACPEVMLVVSGPENDEGIHQTEVTAAAAQSLGLSASRIRQLDRPTNTAGEAAATRAMVGDTTVVWLVTSAIHMRRAVYWFEQEGLCVVPAPTNYLVKKDSTYRWYTWSPVQNIQLLDALLHEVVGLAWAHWLTR